MTSRRAHVPSYYEEPAEENIFNLVPQKPPTPPKPPMYQSKTADKPLSSFGHQSGKHSNFGKPTGSYKTKPQDYMRSFQKSHKVDTLKTLKKASPEKVLLKPENSRRHPPVPSRDDKPIMGLVTNKNFIVANAVEVILAQPRKLNQEPAHFMTNEGYGEVPKYLGEIKQAINDEYSAIKEIMAAQEEASQATREMTQEERTALINGLKAKWEANNHEYQQQAHLVTLSPGEKARKEGLEASLADLEKKIEKFSGHGPILVALDQ